MPAGILTPVSTGGETAPAPTKPAPTPPPAPPQTTLTQGNPLANASNITPAAAPPMHSNEAINSALMNAFHPIVPDQINSLLGPAMGMIQGHTPPISFYQPRQATPVPGRKS